MAYDSRKQSIYVPGDILTKLIEIRDTQDIPMSRIVSDAFRLLEANIDAIDWDIDRVHLKKRFFKKAVKK